MYAMLRYGYGMAMLCLWRSCEQCWDWLMTDWLMNWLRDEIDRWDGMGWVEFRNEEKGNEEREGRRGEGKGKEEGALRSHLFIYNKIFHFRFALFSKKSVIRAGTGWLCYAMLCYAMLYAIWDKGNIALSGIKQGFTSLQSICQGDSLHYI